MSEQMNNHETVHVVVTQDHIDRGCRMLADNCPVYYGIMDAIGDRYPNLFVTNTHVLLDNPDTDNHDLKHLSELPAFVSDLIRCYDDGLGMKPFEFDLTIPQISK